MAAGAFRLAREDCLPALRVAGQLDQFLCPLQGSQVSYNSVDVRALKRAEGRHSGSRNAILNNVNELRIGESLRLWAFRNVRRTFATSAIEAMTGCASGRESLLALHREPLGV